MKTEQKDPPGGIGEASLRRWTTDRLAELSAGALAGWQALRVEASHRRFYRVTCAGGDGYVVMASPPERENNPQFEHLAKVFARHGIGVPAVHARDPERGYFLLSDLGRRHFEDVYRDEGAQRVMPAALDTLIRLQQVADPQIPPYTRERFADELGIYRTWFLDALLDGAAASGLDGVFERLLETLGRQGVCCVHRDFHSRNLLLTPTGGIGVVDFQDALMGPPTYDLASLLRDCYHCFPESEVARWREVYLARTPLELDEACFAEDLDFIALQRQLKAVGIFSRLYLRDGKPTHLEHIVPVLERVHRLAAGYPALRALSEHTRTLLPAARRRLERAP